MHSYKEGMEYKTLRYKARVLYKHYRRAYNVSYNSNYDYEINLQTLLLFGGEKSWWRLHD